MQPILLALHRPRVPGHEPLRLQRRPVAGLRVHEGAADAQAGGLGLAHDAPAMGLDNHVVGALQPQDLQRVAHSSNIGGVVAQVLHRGAAIEGDCPRAWVARGFRAGAKHRRGQAATRPATAKGSRTRSQRTRHQVHLGGGRLAAADGGVLHLPSGGLVIGADARTAGGQATCCTAECTGTRYREHGARAQGATAVRRGGTASRKVGSHTSTAPKTRGARASRS